MSHPKLIISNAWRLALAVVGLSLCAASAPAAPLLSSTGDPGARVSTASSPVSQAKVEIKSGDNFMVSSPTTIANATFAGLVPPGSTAIDAASAGFSLSAQAVAEPATLLLLGAGLALLWWGFKRKR
jgi:hypothetical protein